MQSEALVILLQETHCTNAEKSVLPNYQLAGSSLSRNHGLATFVHERLRYTFLDYSPLTSEIQWLCVDVDGYKIVNVYKPPPTRLRILDLPVFPHPCLYAGGFNCCHADWGYDDNSPDGECLAGWASINFLALLYNAKDAASFYSGRWNTGTNPDLAFASVDPNSRLPETCPFDKFPRSQQPKRLSHACIEITIFRVGMQSVNPSIKLFCSLLRETTQVWLLQLYLPSSISISIFYFCSATTKTERNKQTYRTIAEEEKGRSNKTLNVIACRQ